MKGSIPAQKYMSVSMNPDIPWGRECEGRNYGKFSEFVLRLYFADPYS